MGLCVSPDGAFAAAIGPGRIARLYPIAGGAPRIVQGAQPGEVPVRFAADGRHLYTVRLRLNSAEVYRIELDSGRREPWKELTAADRAGYSPRAEVQITPDGNYYAYTYRRALHDLFLVEGLR